MLLTLLIIGLVLLVIGTITDFRFREVPDWLSFGGIFAGLGLRLLWSLYSASWLYLIEGLLGFGALFLFGLIMFRFGQWGGGDSKVLMALGAILGLQLEMDSALIAFFVNSMLAGAVYGMVWSFFLAFRNWKKFKKAFMALLALKDFKKAKRKSVFVGVGLLILSVLVPDPTFKIGAAVTAVMVLIFAYLYAFVKGVELSCMYKNVTPEQLTVGDWIAKNIVIKGRYICGPKDLGVEKNQIRLLKKLKIKKILIRTGIPFVPSFLIAYILMLWIGNPLSYFL